MEENYNIHNSLVKCINEWLQSPARRHLIFSVNSICMRPIAACTSCKLQAVRGSPLHLKRPTREPMHSRFFRDWLDYRTQTLAYCEITCRRHFAHHSEDISCGAKASHMFSAWFFLSLVSNKPDECYYGWTWPWLGMNLDRLQWKKKEINNRNETMIKP